jgi:hypothetical protein
MLDFKGIIKGGLEIATGTLMKCLEHFFNICWITLTVNHLIIICLLVTPTVLFKVTEPARARSSS